ncbi:MAG: glycosyltransferase [Caldilineaceae bacterium]|nr:glycosyltransferase [Caldilineaceae bacterium]
MRIWGNLDPRPGTRVCCARRSATTRRSRWRGASTGPELGRALADMDVLVVPSVWYENAPLVIQEAFATGTPVITADFGGMREAVTDHLDGLCSSPGDVPALAACGCGVWWTNLNCCCGCAPAFDPCAPSTRRSTSLRRSTRAWCPTRPRQVMRGRRRSHWGIRHEDFVHFQWLSTLAMGRHRDLHRRLAKGLRAAGHHVQVLCGGHWSQGEGYWNGVTDEVVDGVPVRRINLNWTKAPDPARYLYDDPETAAFLRGYLAEVRPDVVHVTSCERLSASVLPVVKETGLPLVLSLT